MGVSTWLTCRLLGHKTYRQTALTTLGLVEPSERMVICERCGTQFSKHTKDENLAYLRELSERFPRDKE